LQWPAFATGVPAAFSLLEQTDAALAAEIRGLIVQVIGSAPLSPAMSFGGVTSLTLWGAVTLNTELHRTPLAIAEALVHEGAHMLLFGYAVDERLVRNPDSERFASPLRSDPRPMDGVFHATFVCARLHLFYRRLLERRPQSLHDLDPRALEQKITALAARFDDGARLIADKASLTPLGRRYCAHLSTAYPMTLQLDQRAREAVIHGPPRTLADGAAPTVIANIAGRVADLPDGLIRSFQADGTLREQTFADTWRRSGEIAAPLRSLGVGPGSQTILLLSDLLDFVSSFWASLRVGATAVPFGGVAHTATVEELEILAARLERPALIADAPTPDLHRLAALLPDAPILDVSSLSGKDDGGENEDLDPRDEPDLICLLPTSGSTGTVKLVMLDRRAILNRNFSQNYSVGHLRHQAMNVFAFEGISGLGATFLRFTSLTQLHPRILTARPLAIFEAVERFAITIVQMTNSMAARLVEDAANEERSFDLGSLKMIGLGGETVTRLVAERFDALLRQHGAAGVLRAGYGMTETSSLLGGADPSACSLDEAGAPILGGATAGISLRIVDDDGLTLDEGEVGLVEAFAPQTLFSGYWKEPELSRDCMTADGWYRTGDLGAINDGGFSFRGRAKQTLVVGGRKFSLDDIDACLQTDADIGRQTVSFVFRGGADATDRLGVAIAVSEGEALDDVSTDGIRRALVRRYGLAPAVMTPVRSGEWPLTATGKVDRRALAERAAKGGGMLNAATTQQAPDSVDEEILASLWREALNLGRGFSPNDHKFSEVGDDFGRDDNFFDCGGESLRAAALLISVDKQFKRQFALREFFALPTFNNLLRLLEGASSAAADEQETSAWPLP
jgi:acyl-CoA synthetase (AMP-forming)/AMP-acid ligase II